MASRWEFCPGRTPSRAPVTHSYAALVYCTGGQARVELNGEWRLRAGEALLVPAGQPHRTAEWVRPRCWALSFSATCFAAQGAAAFLEPFERVRDGASAVVQIPSARHEHLEGLLRELERVGAASRGPDPGLDAVERSLLTLVLAELGRAGSASGQTAPPGGAVVGGALRFIERHCLGALTLSDVAAAVDRSPAYVTAALTKATGRSVGRWIVSGRMAEARRLLLHSTLRVEQVAARVGYADVTHFIRMFRREHGLTPAAWRSSQARAQEAHGGDGV